ncbi:MAG: hypothetical protein ABW210_14150 [Achromobacter sp.]
MVTDKSQPAKQPPETQSPAKGIPDVRNPEGEPADTGHGTEKTAVHPETTGNEDPGSELNSPPERDKQ